MTITVPEDIADNIVIPSATAADSKKYFNGKAGSVASLVNHAVYSKPDFTPTECFVLDYGIELFLWFVAPVDHDARIGKDSSLELRTSASDFLTVCCRLTLV